MILWNLKTYLLILIRNTKGYRCGAFTSKAWSSCNSYVSDQNTFLFSLEFQERYFNYDGNYAFYDNSSYGPCFGSSGSTDKSDLFIGDSFNNGNCYCNFPYYFSGTRVRSLSGGYFTFKVDEMEVYEI